VPSTLFTIQNSVSFCDVIFSPHLQFIVIQVDGVDDGSSSSSDNEDKLVIAIDEDEHQHQKVQIQSNLSWPQSAYCDQQFGVPILVLKPTFEQR